MNYLEILNRLEQAPTMMSAAEELGYVKEVIGSEDAPLRNMQLLLRILDGLTVSHTEAFYEVTKETQPQFARFADWLEEVGSQTHDRRQVEALMDAAATFRLAV